MKRITLPVLIFFALTLNCGTSLSDREQCYKKEYCDSAGPDCLAGTLFLDSLLKPSSSSTSYATTISAGSTTTEYESNDTFAQSNQLYPYNTSYFAGRAGSMSSGADVDIYNVSFTSSSNGSSSRSVYLTQFSGTATCTAYTRASSTSVFNATIDGTFTLIGNLSSTSRTVTQNLSSSSFIYILCSGASGNSYEVRASVDLIDTTSTSGTSSTSTNSLTNVLLLSCVDAKRACIADCNRKHAF